MTLSAFISLVISVIGVAVLVPVYRHHMTMLKPFSLVVESESQGRATDIDRANTMTLQIPETTEILTVNS